MAAVRALVVYTLLMFVLPSVYVLFNYTYRFKPNVCPKWTPAAVNYGSSYTTPVTSTSMQMVRCYYSLHVFFHKIQFTGQHIYLEFVIASCADYRLGNLYLFRPSTSPLWGFSSCRLSFCYTCFHCLSGYSRPPSTTCSDVYCGGRKLFTRAGRRHARPRASRCC